MNVNTAEDIMRALTMPFKKQLNICINEVIDEHFKITGEQLTRHQVLAGMVLATEELNSKFKEKKKVLTDFEKVANQIHFYIATLLSFHKKSAGKYLPKEFYIPDEFIEDAIPYDEAKWEDTYRMFKKYYALYKLLEGEDK